MSTHLEDDCRGSKRRVLGEKAGVVHAGPRQEPTEMCPRAGEATNTMLCEAARSIVPPPQDIVLVLHERAVGAVRVPGATVSVNTLPQDACELRVVPRAAA